MEEEFETEKPANNSLKRPLPSDAAPSKKVRLNFTAQDFRNQIKNEQKTQALQNFLQLISETTKNDVIRTYFEGGGSVLEILQLIEGESGVSPVLIFDIVNRILLQISAKLVKYQKSASDACRYLVNNYITLINKMLGLSSSFKERLATLRLLTTVITCSPLVAKDVLLHVNFNPTNLELLTKVIEGKSEVRGAFIHLITAFLVDGHFPALAVLLEKRGLMTSIIHGLQYDKADIVVLVITAMKNHILENGSVSKTVKMRTFNTQVVKDIVNLYNWKGPGGLINQKSKTKTVVIDDVEKSKVSEAVHSFLLVLCTSHRFGVIFKDPMVGLGKRLNSLMYTVLESLERPWEHSYAGELVVKICRACPDLVKTMWINLKPYIEPRWTVKWLKAIQFASRLLDELQPEFIEANTLNTHQLSQVITILTAPLPILKTLLPESCTFDQPAIKYNIISLILKMTESIEKYLTFFNNQVLNIALANYIQKNFPDTELILSEWDKTDSDSSVSDYLNVALDLLVKYKILAPKVFHESGLNLDVESFVMHNEMLSESLKVKAVNIFVSLEPTLFRPKSDLFQTVLTFSMEFYYNTRDTNVLALLNQLFTNLSIFDGFNHEIDFWIDGILNLKSFDKSIPDFLTSLIQNVDDNAPEYHKRLLDMRGANFSPLVLSLSGLTEADVSKTIRTYLSFVLLNVFHIQVVELAPFTEIICSSQLLPATLTNYFDNWHKLNTTPLDKFKGKLTDQFSKFSHDFLESNLQISSFDLYPNFQLNLLQTVIFYVTNLLKADSLKDNHVINCHKFVEYLITENAFDDDRYIRTVLGNPTLLQTVTLDTASFSTKLVVDVVKGVKSAHLEKYLVELREKIVANVSKILRKPRKYQNLTFDFEIIETISLNYEQCTKLVAKFVSSYDNKSFCQVICYCLNRMAELGRNYDLEPLNNETVNQISNFLTLLIKDEAPNLWHLSVSLHKYLKVFPHNLEGVGTDLFDSLVTMKEFNKENVALCEFLLDRTDCWSVFVKHLHEICSKKGFILNLLDVVIQKSHDWDNILENVFTYFENHIVKALQKPHKAGQHFQNRYKSVGILIDKFMKPDAFGTQVQKFEVTELFHVYLLKKVYDKVEKNDKILTNMITTFSHLLTNLLKQKKENVCEIGEIVYAFLHEIEDSDIILSNSESFKQFCKLCLKHGVTGDFILIRILTELIGFCVEDDAKLILEMLMSHSQFLDVILGDSRKDDVLNLWLIICTKWPQFMERNHVPLLLSAYKGTIDDSVALKLLKMYEAKAVQTKFFDFKPFLWSRAAASHYSVRSDLQKVLWRQPKMSDVLNNLNFGTITLTINDPTSENAYDLDYFLPLFSHLLAPENPVATYHFTKSGALALALVGLRSDKPQRLAACHVLQRFYFHLEAKQSGKDNVLWLRFIEAICKGIAVFEDFKINNFVGVFLARAALVLAQPNHVMYVPISQYLTAKDSLDFSTIPELYTFLHSPHVDAKDHKKFILEVLRDGLRNENDFTALLRSMGFKLISELCSSTVCDLQTKILILEVFEQCCKLELGVKVLCGRLSFLPQVFSLVVKNVQEEAVLVKLLTVLLRIVETDTDRHRNFVVYLNLITLAEEEQYFQCVKESAGVDIYYKSLVKIVQRFPSFFSKEHVDTFLKRSNDEFCKYLVQYDCQFVKEDDLLKDSKSYYLRSLFYQKLKLRHC